MERELDYDAPVHHVALVGYGTLLVPRAPFELGSTSAELDDVVIVHHAAVTQHKARIVPGPEGCRLQLGPGTGSIDEVVEVLEELEEPSAPDGWRLELGALVLPRPGGVTVWSVPAETRWSAELTLPGGTTDELAYLLGPFAPHDPPRLEQLVAPGMSVVADEQQAGPYGPIRMLELAYSSADVAFRQWRVLAPLADGAHALVTAQAALERRGPMRELAWWLGANVERSDA